MFDFKKLYLEEIKKFCKQSKVPLIDGIVHWCEKNNMEIDYMANLIKKDKRFKNKLYREAKKTNSVKVRKRKKLHK
jgi:Phage late-transcription coactivator